MGRPPRPMILPDCLRALDAAEICLRAIGSDWRNMPGHLRKIALDCANAALTVLLRAGFR